MAPTSTRSRSRSRPGRGVESSDDEDAEVLLSLHTRRSLRSTRASEPSMDRGTQASPPFAFGTSVKRVSDTADAASAGAGTGPTSARSLRSRSSINYSEIVQESPERAAGVTWNEESTRKAATNLTNTPLRITLKRSGSTRMSTHGHDVPQVHVQSYHTVLDLPEAIGTDRYLEYDEEQEQIEVQDIVDPNRNSTYLPSSIDRQLHAAESGKSDAESPAEGTAEDQLQAQLSGQSNDKGLDPSSPHLNMVIDNDQDEDYIDSGNLQAHPESSPASRTSRRVAARRSAPTNGSDESTYEPPESVVAKMRGRVLESSSSSSSPSVQAHGNSDTDQSESPLSDHVVRSCPPTHSGRHDSPPDTDCHGCRRGV